MGVNLFFVLIFVSYFYSMNANIILQEFSRLSIDEQEKLLYLLADQWDHHEGRFNQVVKELEAVHIKAPACVHCESSQTIKRARIKSVQRYYCKSCHKYWMVTHGTSLAGLHKRELWQKYVMAFERGYSIRKAALELGISIQTSFRWRHRLLASISGIMLEELPGIIETDDFQMPRNLKGQRTSKHSHAEHDAEFAVTLPETITVLLASSRSEIATTSRIIAAEKPHPEQIKKALDGRIRKGSLLISQENDAFNFLMDDKNIEHVKVPNHKRPRKKNYINLHLVDLHQQSIKQFLLPFHGVATKYLQNYLNWYHYKERIRMRMDKIRHTIFLCLIENGAKDWIQRKITESTIIIT